MARRVVLACKKTTLDVFVERYGPSWRTMLARFDLELPEVEEEHQEHYRAVDELVDAFRAVGIQPEVFLRRSYDRQSFAGADLVVSIGGDGEMLDTARYVRGPELVCGFRSHHRSAGQLLLPPEISPRCIAERFVAGRFQVEDWTRIRGTVHNDGPTVTDLALNEIYIGDRYSVGTAHYTLHLDGIEEKQRSSGLLVCTGTGSTGWYAHVAVPGNGCCHRGAPFDRRSPELRFVVRDLIETPEARGRASGQVLPGVSFTIKSTMIADGLISFDCSKPTYETPRAYAFNRGAWVEISAAAGSLRVMCLE